MNYSHSSRSTSGCSSLYVCECIRLYLSFCTHLSHFCRVCDCACMQVNPKSWHELGKESRFCCRWCEINVMFASLLALSVNVSRNVRLGVECGCVMLQLSLKLKVCVSVLWVSVCGCISAKDVLVECYWVAGATLSLSIKGSFIVVNAATKVHMLFFF